MSNERKMKRGRSQVLYKYLPEAWIDFSVRSPERKEYIAKVDHWNSKKIDDINSKRLIRTINEMVMSYRELGEGKGPISSVTGFGAELTSKTCNVLTPNSSDVERGVVANISPLTFFCDKCHKVYQFKSEESYRKLRKCVDCGRELTQFRLIYFCKCGFATADQPSCKKHGTQKLYWNSTDFSFYCKECKKKIPMRMNCKVCGEYLSPKNALDPTQYYVYSLNLIDLIDEKLENFITNEDYGKFIVILYWLGKITEDELFGIIEKGITTDRDEYEKQYAKFYEMMFRCFNDENQAAQMATELANDACGNKYSEMIDQIKSGISISENNLRKQSEMLLEYTMVKCLKDNADLDCAIKVSKKLNTTANPEDFKPLAKKYNIVNSFACDKIPFVTCSYGYTRVKCDYENGVQLHAFKEEEPGKKNIYATRMETESVVFEFDRAKIIKWLFENKYIEEDEMPNLDSEEEVKLWFINNIDLESIHTFSEIDLDTAKTTYYVYRLIHSIAHLLIRAAASIGGLGKDSLSEYVFPGIPAILIYCQNSQGFSLGSLFNTFEAYFDKWLNKTNTLAQKCIFDPICIERDKACAGCLFLNEISCQHFNKDLDRTLVIGHYDSESKTKTVGFWEE